MCTEDEAAAFPVSDNQICAVGASTSASQVGSWKNCNTCISLHYFSSQGDSGGPISLKSGDQHVQVGDVSFGPGCLIEGFTVSAKLIIDHS